MTCMTVLEAIEEARTHANTSNMSEECFHRLDAARALADEVERLQELLRRIQQHWEDGVSEDTEAENSWHGTMRDLLDEAAEAAKEEN